MESLPFFFFFFFFSSLIFILTLLYLLFTTKKKTKNSSSSLPPIAPFIPILDHIRWLRRSLLDIGSILRTLRSEYGPIITFNFGPFPAIFVLDRNLAVQSLVGNGAVFSDRPPPEGPTSVFSSNGYQVNASNGDLWRLLRRNLVQSTLSPSRMGSFAEGRRWALGSLVGDLKEESDGNDGVVVPIGRFRFAMFRLLSVMCFGEKLDGEIIRDVERAQRDVLFMLLKLRVFTKIEKFLLWGRWRKFLAAVRRQQEVMTPIIRRNRDNHHKKQEEERFPSYLESLFGLRLPAENGRKLNEEEMISLCSEFFDAGTDTISSAMEWIMANIVKHQNVQRRLIDEIYSAVTGEEEIIKEENLHNLPYLKAVVLESLRLHPPVHFALPHMTSDDTHLAGYDIPKGTVVNFALMEVGRDETVWDDPLEFRPERFLKVENERMTVDEVKTRKMMPFGIGRRMCPGMNFAVAHLEYFVGNLVREFEWKTVIAGDDVDLSEKFELAVVMNESLRVRIVTRKERESRNL